MGKSVQTHARRLAERERESEREKLVTVESKICINHLDFRVS
jgi:hypothetical protein